MEKSNFKQKCENNKYINKLVIIRNCISLICFTALAIVFHKWWIVFGVLLFISTVGKGE